jgi:hypothetical protein
MKRIIILGLAGCLVSAGTPALLAQVSTNSPGQTAPQSPGTQQKHEQRRELMRILGMNPKDLKGMAPADRRAKIKEAADQKVAELQQQKTAGTITAEGQTDLAFLQNYLQHTKRKPAAAN